VALFSDVDWIIVLVAAAFLLFGKDNSQTLRTLGRWYGRAGRLKQELLAEFTKAAELPTPGPGQALSIRGALLGLDPTPTHARGIPAAVRTPPAAPPPPVPGITSPWTGGYPTPVWSMTAGGAPVVQEART
jgi:hypothetical protein